MKIVAEPVVPPGARRGAAVLTAELKPVIGRVPAAPLWAAFEPELGTLPPELESLPVQLASALEPGSRARLQPAGCRA